MPAAPAHPHTPLWLWPNLLSLDAPVIAVLWQHFLSQSLGTGLRPAARGALGLTVWTIYLADRILDVRREPAPDEPALHRFYRRHVLLTRLLLVIVAVCDLALVLLWLRPPVFHNGALVLAGVGLYLAAHHLTGGIGRGSKEAAVAVLFTCGTFLVAWTNAPDPWDLLAVPAFAFFLVCLANLMALNGWEREGPPRWLLAALVILAAACFTAGGKSPLYRALGLGAAGIGAAVALGRRVPPDLRRTLVDASLLSPILFLL